MTLITWPAFSQRYQSRSQACIGSAADRPDQRLDMARIGLGRDAMAEVEDMGSPPHHLDDPACLFLHRLAAGHHQHRVEIALKRHAGHRLSRPVERHLGVEPNARNSRSLGKSAIERTGTPRKSDY